MAMSTDSRQPKVLRKQAKVNHAAIAKALRLLQTQELVTSHEVAEETGLHTVTAQEFMRTLRKFKVVYVASWEKDRLGRDCTPVYCLGDKRDVPRARMTPAQRTARYRKKKELEKWLKLSA